MAIEEIPIDIEETQDNEESEIPQPEDPVESEEIPQPEAPTPKRRGRPPGAKNKAKPKPRPPPVIKRSMSRRRPPTPEDSEESEEEEEYQPPPRPRRRQQEVDPDPMRTTAAEMLHLMQSQSANRQQARVNKYASWFPQSYA